jgi:hypothetical protein
MARPYKVICISMYSDDMKALDDLVEDLKSKGTTRASRSSLIRFALSHLRRAPTNEELAVASVKR